VRAVRAQTAWRRLPPRIARGCDSFLDFVVVAFAAWTAIYHLFLVTGIGAVAAAVVFVVALVPAPWVAFRWRDDPADPPTLDHEPGLPDRRLGIALLVFAGASLGVAALFAFSELAWALMWALFMAAALASLLLALGRLTGRLRLSFGEAHEEGPGGPELLVVFVWAIALAILSLFLVRAAADDAYYARLSSWIAAHGSFPTRDVIFSDNVFPAVIYPPVSSFEALVGTVGHITSVAIPNVLYLGLTPVASALSVFAMWRLLRRWSTPMAWLALSVALVFLLYDAQSRRTFGNLFIGRIWEGKVALVVILVPLLFVFMTDYLERPSRRRLSFLAAGGAAGVGLTSTAIFLVPVIAAGGFAPFALRAPRRALLGFAALSAYPLGALAVRALVGGRRAAEDVLQNVVAGNLIHYVLGVETLALVAVAALLFGPLVVRRVAAAPLVAGVVALVVLFYAPPVPRFIWEVSGIGMVLWRVNWAVPAAVLVGVVATSVLAGVRPRVLRLVPALALIAVLVAAGTALWSAVPVAGHPSWKLPPSTIRPARQIVSAAEPGDVVLAPRLVSQTVSIMSGDVTTVAPRVFYALALRGTPEAHAEDRVVLQTFAELGLGATVYRTRQFEPEDQTVDAADVTRALRTVGVDIACIVRNPDAEALLASAGYSPFTTIRSLICMRGSAAR
jgi:Family of unknown function (DUF6077)